MFLEGLKKKKEKKDDFKGQELNPKRPDLKEGAVFTIEKWLYRVRKVTKKDIIIRPLNRYVKGTVN